MGAPAAAVPVSVVTVATGGVTPPEVPLPPPPPHATMRRNAKEKVHSKVKLLECMPRLYFGFLILVPPSLCWRIVLNVKKLIPVVLNHPLRQLFNILQKNEPSFL
jgi:hypothetical protein